MGYYIEVPKSKDKAIICVVDNGPFEAAGFAYSQRELDFFSIPDGRPRTWVVMDRKRSVS